MPSVFMMCARPRYTPLYAVVELPATWAGVQRVLGLLFRSG